MTILPVEIPLETLRKIMERCAAEKTDNMAENESHELPRFIGIPGASSVVPTDSPAGWSGSRKG